jgi:hypothetical protein
MFGDDRFDHPFNAEAIAAALANAAAAEGDAASVAALAISVPEIVVVSVDEWVEDYRDNIKGLSLYLKVPQDAFGQLFRVREGVQKRILGMFKPIVEAHRIYFARGAFIIPADEAPSDWRKQALAWLRGEGITN